MDLDSDPFNIVLGPHHTSPNHPPQSVSRGRDDPDIEYCPHCYNSRGPKYVKERAKELTDPEVYTTYGNGEFPLLFRYHYTMLLLRGILVSDRSVFVYFPVERAYGSIVCVTQHSP